MKECSGMATVVKRYQGIGRLTLLDLEIRVSRFTPLPYSTVQTHSS